MKKIFKKSILINSLFLIIAFTSACTSEKQYGEWQKTGNMVQSRHNHSAILLDDGNVLVVGGNGKIKTLERGWVLDYLKSAELYLPKEKKFIKVGDMKYNRINPCLVKLEDGRVAVAGGYKIPKGPDVRDVEIYDPKTRQFTLFGKTQYVIEEVIAPNYLPLKSGKIYIYSINGRAEVYDPMQNKSQMTSQVLHYRSSPAFIELNDGRILISGGGIGYFIKGKLDKIVTKEVNGLAVQGETTKSIEIYDPITDKYELAGRMQIERSDHSMLLLPDNKVLIVGGNGEYRKKYITEEFYNKNVHPVVRRNYSYENTPPMQALIQDIEIYDPKTKISKIVGNLNYAVNPKQLHLLNDRYILVSGGIGIRDELIDLVDFKTYPAKKVKANGSRISTQISKNTLLFTGEDAIEIFKLKQSINKGE